MSKFNIGDKVWWAHLVAQTKKLLCPDCAGNRYVTVILGDGSQVTVDCTGCESGYEGSLGYVNVYEYEAMAQLTEIRRVEIEIKDGKSVVEYGISGSWCVDELDIFLSEQFAHIRAMEKAIEQSNVEMKRFLEREKPKRSWAWNATYHRQCLKRALHDVEYHTKKLDMANQHSKTKGEA